MNLEEAKETAKKTCALVCSDEAYWKICLEIWAARSFLEGYEAGVRESAVAASNNEDGPWGNCVTDVLKLLEKLND